MIPEHAKKCFFGMFPGGVHSGSVGRAADFHTEVTGSNLTLGHSFFFSSFFFFFLIPSNSLISFNKVNKYNYVTMEFFFLFDTSNSLISFKV